MNNTDATYLGLTQEELKWFFQLNMFGRLINNPNRPDHTFKDDKHIKRYFNNYAGRLTSNTPDRNGYALVRVLTDRKRVGYRYMVVWFLMHGWLPPQDYQIIHVDGDKLNDFPSNLAMTPVANPTPLSTIQPLTTPERNAHLCC
jgi:hypothetical protein